MKENSIQIKPLNVQLSSHVHKGVDDSNTQQSFVQQRRRWKSHTQADCDGLESLASLSSVLLCFCCPLTKIINYLQLLLTSK